MGWISGAERQVIRGGIGRRATCGREAGETCWFEYDGPSTAFDCSRKADGYGYDELGLGVCRVCLVELELLVRAWVATAYGALSDHAKLLPFTDSGIYEAEKICSSEIEPVMID